MGRHKATVIKGISTSGNRINVQIPDVILKEMDPGKISKLAVDEHIRAIRELLWQGKDARGVKLKIKRSTELRREKNTKPPDKPYGKRATQKQKERAAIRAAKNAERVKAGKKPLKARKSTRKKAAKSAFAKRYPDPGHPKSLNNKIGFVDSGSLVDSMHAVVDQSQPTKAWIDIHPSRIKVINIMKKGAYCKGGKQYFPLGVIESELDTATRKTLEKQAREL